MFNLICNLSVMGNMFSAMWNKFYNSLRGLPDIAQGAIIFGVIMGALVCFIFAVKGSKKDKMVKNWFLFFLCILLTIIGVALCFIL
ncbi:MAG: hypothetical protein IKB42_01150 [Clostridia bacterium]|nr:hypothetical protein [Clostridia bacterium]